MNCHYCNGKCMKKGFTGKRIQRYRCKNCNKFQQSGYSNQGCIAGQPERIVLLYLEGLGIRSLSRILGVSTNTILKTLYRESLKVSRPLVILRSGKIEIDELQTYVTNKKKNKKWIAYALERNTGMVIDFRHCTKKYRINKIERMNLQLRTDLKRLNRKTICFSKSERMLVASLKLFFWYKKPVVEKSVQK